LLPLEGPWLVNKIFDLIWFVTTYNYGTAVSPNGRSGEWLLDIKQREITAILFKRYAGILKFGFKISGLSYIIQKCADIDPTVDICPSRALDWLIKYLIWFDL
jgi:hypothetical protein